MNIDIYHRIKSSPYSNWEISIWLLVDNDQKELSLLVSCLYFFLRIYYLSFLVLSSSRHQKLSLPVSFYVCPPNMNNCIPSMQVQCFEIPPKINLKSGFDLYSDHWLAMRSKTQISEKRLPRLSFPPIITIFPLLGRRFIEWLTLGQGFYPLPFTFSNFLLIFL